MIKTFCSNQPFKLQSLLGFRLTLMFFRCKNPNKTYSVHLVVGSFILFSCVFARVTTCVGVLGQRWVLDALALGLWLIVSHVPGVLGTELGFL